MWTDGGARSTARRLLSILGSSTLQRILHPLRATVAQPPSLSLRCTTSASATQSTVTLPPAIPLAHAAHIPALKCTSLQCTAQQQAPSYRHLQRSRTPAGDQDGQRAHAHAILPGYTNRGSLS